MAVFSHTEMFHGRLSCQTKSRDELQIEFTNRVHGPNHVRLQLLFVLVSRYLLGLRNGGKRSGFEARIGRRNLDSYSRSLRCL